MRYILTIVLLLFLVTISFAQKKKRDKVKRKYRNVEAVSNTLPKVFIRGKVYDENKTPLAGASVSIDGTPKTVNTNTDGEYLIQNLVTGRARVRVSFVGYKTRTPDIILRPGQNEKNVMLPMDNIHFEPLWVNVQKREQQIIDVPTTISSVSEQKIWQHNITQLHELSNFVPGLQVQQQGVQQTNFIIRGAANDKLHPSSQPNVSIHLNNAPMNRANWLMPELYDMERIEILRGAQNTLFGKAGQTGAVHFHTKMPEDNFSGKVMAGVGNYGQKEIQGMLNLPAVKNKLLFRAASIYKNQNGYILPTSEGKSMKNKILGTRFSTLFRPNYNHKLSLVLSYQRSTSSGIDFIQNRTPEENNTTTSTFEQGVNLGTNRKSVDATINYNLLVNEHTYLSVISTYRTGNFSSQWNNNEMPIPTEHISSSNIKQFYQEIRANFSLSSRINGSLGANYWWEKANWNYLLRKETNTKPITSSLNNQLYDINSAAEGFVDLSYQLSRKLFFLGSFRAIYDRDKQNTNYLSEINNNALYYTYKGGLKYRFNEYGNIFTNYARGVRPASLQLAEKGEKEIIDADVINNFELGFKRTFYERVFLGFTGFYQMHKNFQGPTLLMDSTSGQVSSKIANAGKGISYGAEADMQVVIAKQLSLFANYAWLKTRFDSLNANGAKQKYAGNIFRLAPEHSLTIGANLNLQLTNNLKFFMHPSYSYKTTFFFDNANSSNRKQSAYGVLNIHSGLGLNNPNLILSVWATNLLNQGFINSIKSIPNLPNLQTIAPGAPRMIGTKLTWKFAQAEKWKRRNRKAWF